MISMCGGRLRFLIKDRLHNIQGFPVTRKRRHDLEESEDIRACDEFGYESDTDDEPSDQVNQAEVAPAKASPKTVDWNVFHASVGHMSRELLSATAKSMGVTLTGHLHQCEGCLAARGIRKSIPKSTETRSVKPFGRIYCDLTGPRKQWPGVANVAR